MMAVPLDTRFTVPSASTVTAALSLAQVTVLSVPDTLKCRVDPFRSVPS